MEKRKQLTIVMFVYFIYVALILIANILMRMSVANNSESLEAISGMLMGFVAIPVFSLFLPLWFAKRWQLPCSFWPKNKELKVIIPILALYILLANFEPIKVVLSTGVSLKDFVIHYISVMLFHVTYYPLLAVFMFPVMRKIFGLTRGLIFTSLAFALYHLAQFHNFPAGTTPVMQVFLFVAFVVNLLFYLWSESIILITIVHNTGGAIALIANGALFNQIDFVLFLTIFIMLVLFGYMVHQEIQTRKKKTFDADWWLQIRIK